MFLLRVLFGFGREVEMLTNEEVEAIRLEMLKRPHVELTEEAKRKLLKEVLEEVNKNK